MTKNEKYGRLRELGKQLAEIAALPEQERHRKLWTSLNDLKVIRPVVHVRDYPLFLLQPNPELETRLETTAEDAFLSDIEQTLLLRIYEWNHLRVDRVVEPIVECPAVFTDSGFGIEGYTNQASNNVKKEFYDTAKHFEPVLKTMDDLDKIKNAVVEYDEETTMKRRDLLCEIFDGILPVKIFGKSHFRCATMDDLITCTGIDEGMYLFLEDPDFLHALAERYIDVQIDRIKQYERLGLISSNNNSKNIGNNGPGFTTQLPPPTKNGIGAKIGTIWGENADQIMTAISPEMTKEFAFDHEKRWATMFPLHSYGCCERLDHKLQLLTEAFPNLRKVTSSPFNDLDSTAEQLGDRYVICFKPHSVHLAGDRPNFEHLRNEIIHGCELAEKQHLNLVFNMKTLITLNNEPERLWRWCDMAMEIIHSHFGE